MRRLVAPPPPNECRPDAIIVKHRAGTAARWTACGRRSLAVAAGLLASLLGGSAAAHIDMLSPEPRSAGNRARTRDTNSNLKEAPCGQVVNGRTEAVTELVGGQVLEVRFTEWVNHDSYYRVAFDVDGDDDFPLRPGPAVPRVGDDPRRVFPVDGRNILAYELEDRGSGEYVMSVEVPNVDCENCTLQLIQYMYDTARAYYFQCADLSVTASSEAGPVLDAETDFGNPATPTEEPTQDASAMDAGVARSTRNAGDEPDASAAASTPTPAATSDAARGCTLAPPWVVSAVDARERGGLAGATAFGLLWALCRRRQARATPQTPRAITRERSTTSGA